MSDWDLGGLVWAGIIFFILIYDVFYKTWRDIKNYEKKWGKW